MDGEDIIWALAGAAIGYFLVHGWGSSGRPA